MRHTATIKHKEFRDDLLLLLKKHSGHLDALEMLALAAHTVGQIIALQDQRTVTPDKAMKLVAENIEQGNQEAIQNLLKETMGKA